MVRGHSTTAQPLNSTDTDDHDVSIVLSGLTAGTSYCAALEATNASGTSTSSTITFTAGRPQVSTYGATPSGATTATATGSVNPAGQSTTYKVVYDTSASMFCQSGGQSGPPAHSTTSQSLGYTDAQWHDVSVALTGLTAGTGYCVALQATNGSGTATDSDNVATFTAGLPASYPTGVTPTNASTATLTAELNPSGQSTTYRAVYDTIGSSFCQNNGQSGTPAHTTAAQTLTYTDAHEHTVSVDLSGLTPGARYCVALRATNSSGSVTSDTNAFTSGQPSAYVTGATSTGGGSGTVTGSVNPAGQTTTYKVLYDISSSAFCQNGGRGTAPAHSTAPQTLPYTDATDHDVSVNLSGLVAATDYCVTIQATNPSAISPIDVSYDLVTSAATAPSVTTGPASDVSLHNATLNGSVDPNGAAATTYHFEYGTTASYGSIAGEGSIGPDGNQGKSASIGALQLNTTYHYRLVATNSTATTFGLDRVFTTGADRTAPTITLKSPRNKAKYKYGAKVSVHFSCVDKAGGSGLASCEGTVANGKPLNTRKLGTHSFTVTARDQAGNTTTATVRYSVARKPKKHH